MYFKVLGWKEQCTIRLKKNDNVLQQLNLVVTFRTYNSCEIGRMTLGLKPEIQITSLSKYKNHFAKQHITAAKNILTTSYSQGTEMLI